MRLTSTSTNLTIFALFFGISLLDALVSRNFWRAAFWLAIGALLVIVGRFHTKDPDSADEA